MGILDLFRRRPKQPARTVGGIGHVTGLGGRRGTITMEDGRLLRFSVADCMGFEPSRFQEVTVTTVEGSRALGIATRPTPQAAATAAAPALEPPPEEPTNAELEQALLAHPDDLETHLVYADWLQSVGHPRGELIALMHSIGQDPHTDLQSRQDRLGALLIEQRRTLLGQLYPELSSSNVMSVLQVFDGQMHLVDHPDNVLRTQWRLGFIRSARVAESWQSMEHDTALGAHELLEALMTHPSGRWLQELTLGLMNPDDEETYAGALEVLDRSGPRPALRSLFIGDFELQDEMEISWTRIGDLGPIWPLYPNLQQVTLQAGDFELGRIDLPALRSFELRTGGLRRACIEAVCQARWPALQRLVVWFGDSNYGAEGTIEDLRPLLAGASVPRLRELGLMNCELTDDICRELPGSAVAARLERLDLSMGTMSDEGARALAAGAQAFGNLKQLNVEQNFLSDDAVQALQGLCAEVRAGDQEQADGDGRFVSVGE